MNYFCSNLFSLSLTLILTFLTIQETYQRESMTRKKCEDKFRQCLEKRTGIVSHEARQTPRTCNDKIKTKYNCAPFPQGSYMLVKTRHGEEKWVLVKDRSLIGEDKTNKFAVLGLSDVDKTTPETVTRPGDLVIQAKTFESLIKTRGSSILS